MRVVCTCAGLCGRWVDVLWLGRCAVKSARHRAATGLTCAWCACGGLVLVWCPWQKYDFGLSPAAVQFFLQLDAAVGKISDPVGSPNLLLQVNSTWHAHIRIRTHAHTAGRIHAGHCHAQPESCVVRACTVLGVRLTRCVLCCVALRVTAGAVQAAAPPAIATTATTARWTRATPQPRSAPTPSTLHVSAAALVVGVFVGVGGGAVSD